MRFPLNVNEMQYPTRKRCAWCKRADVKEPHSMAVLSCGAMFKQKRTRDGGPDDRLEGFLSLTWHGAHTNDGGKGLNPDIYEVLEIAKDVKGGQFNLNFCSTKCLRDFLNHVVDSVEKRIQRKRKYVSKNGGRSTH